MSCLSIPTPEVREHPRRKDSARGSSLAPADALPVRSCRASPSPATARHQRHGRGGGKAHMLAGIEPPPDHVAKGAALHPLAVRPLWMDPAPSPQHHLEQRRTRRASCSARHILVPIGTDRHRHPLWRDRPHRAAWHDGHACRRAGATARGPRPAPAGAQWPAAAKCVGEYSVSQVNPLPWVVR